MTTMQDLYKMISAWQAQKRKQDNAPPWERQSPASATVPMPPALASPFGGNTYGGNKFGGQSFGGNTFGGNRFGASGDQGIGSMVPQGVPGYIPVEGEVVAGGSTSVPLTREEQIAQSIEPNMADRLRREQAVREDKVSGGYLGGNPEQRVNSLRPKQYGDPAAEAVAAAKKAEDSVSNYNPFMDSSPRVKSSSAAEQPPNGGTQGTLQGIASLGDADTSGGNFVSSLSSQYTPSAQSPLGNLPTKADDEGLLGKAFKNPMFLVGAGMMANAKKGPFEAAGIAALNAASIHGKNKTQDADRALLARRIANEETRTANQDAYQRERNDIADRRYDREFEYKKTQRDLETKRINNLLTQNNEANRLKAFAYAEERVNNERKALANSFEAQTNPKVMEEFEKNAEIRFRKYLLQALPQTISYDALAKGPQGIAALAQ